jgi:hypothetical protein
MDHNHDELEPVIDRLRASRPELSALELDGVKQRVRAHVASARRPSRRTQLMKSRLTILAMLVLGMAFSTTGAGLAVSGLSSGDNAGVAQYGAAPAPSPTGQVLGEENAGEEEQGATLPEQEAAAPTQPTRQVEAGAQEQGGEELPFTGFAAIPLLIGGVALLIGGLVLRRRSSTES